MSDDNWQARARQEAFPYLVAIFVILLGSGIVVGIVVTPLLGDMEMLVGAGAGLFVLYPYFFFVLRACSTSSKREREMIDSRLFLFVLITLLTVNLTGCATANHAAMEAMTETDRDERLRERHRSIA